MLDKKYSTKKLNNDFIYLALIRESGESRV